MTEFLLTVSVRVCECGKACEIDRDVEKDSVCVFACAHGVIVCDPGILFSFFFFSWLDCLAFP